MDTETIVSELSKRSSELEALQRKLSQSQLMNNEATKTFIFDLKDYLDSLKLVTDLVPSAATTTVEVDQLSYVLGEQNQSIQQLLVILEEAEANDDQRFFWQKCGRSAADDWQSDWDFGTKRSVAARQSWLSASREGNWTASDD